jgi:hypothetical protein
VVGEGLNALELGRLSEIDEAVAALGIHSPHFEPVE